MLIVRLGEAKAEADLLLQDVSVESGKWSRNLICL